MMNGFERDVFVRVRVSVLPREQRAALPHCSSGVPARDAPASPYRARRINNMYERGDVAE
jgi:hypothetical protein